jgi:hypothetical protein
MIAERKSVLVLTVVIAAHTASAGRSLITTPSINDTSAVSMHSPSQRELLWQGPDSIDSWYWVSARSTWYGGPNGKYDINGGSCGFKWLNNKYITGIQSPEYA